ncbi:MAG: MotA/TolQ/ExbB proton channel family protein [Clostridia bacterium]|nr:MotA/TolQ/ExbB proton channel family protein [Clostridia bacterium]
MNTIFELFQTIDVSGKVIVLIIVCIFAIALIVDILIKIKYRSIAKHLESRQQRRSGVFKNELLNRIVQDYKAASSSPYSDVNTQAIIEKTFMDELRIYLMGESFVKKSIGMLIVLGLLGTFIGLTISVSELVNVLLPNTGTSGSLDWNFILERLGGAAEGMGAAFITSLAGISLSIILTIIFIALDCEDEKNKLMVNIEEYLDNVIAVVISKDKENEYTILNRILRDTFIDFGNKIETSLKDTVNEFGNKLTNVVMDVSLSSQTLDNTIERFDTCLVNFAGSIKDFSEFNTNLRNNIEIMDVSFIKMSESMAESANLIKNNYEAIEKFSEDVKSAASEMSAFNQKVVDDMQSLVEQVDKSVYSVNKLSAVMKESADMNAATIDNVQKAFVQSFTAVNEEIAAMAQKTGEVFTSIMLDGTNEISEKLGTSISEAMDSLDKTVRQFDSNQRTLAATIAALPEQTMAYNKAVSGQINRKLDAIKDEVSK